MEVKGSAVATIQEFVHSKYNSQYDDWLNSLPGESKSLMQNKVLPSSWHKIETAIVIPTEKICNLFYGGDLKGAWEMGRYSADVALSGIYKLFVKVGTPQFIISRASNILSTYYRPGNINIVESNSNSIVVHFSNFIGMHQVIEYRIAGWIERALEISGCSDISLKVSRSMTKGDEISEMIISWK